MTNGLISNLPGRIPLYRPCSICSSAHSARLARICNGTSNPSSRHLHVFSSSSQVSSSVSTATQSLARDESSNADSLDVSLPDELVSLSELVKQLADETSKSEDVEVLKLKEAFGELAEDLKKKIAETSAIPRPTGTQAAVFTPVTIRGYSGSGVTAPRMNPFQTHKAQIESDLEGMIPTQSGVLPTSQDKQVIDRDEVVAMRSRLNKRLSEANTYNRFLLREIQYREDALKDSKAQLLAVSSELESLLLEAEKFGASSPREQAASTLPTQLTERLRELQGGLRKQLEGIESMRLKEVPLQWFGMAEDVKVMGTFDGWTYGEQMSPESTGTYTKFSTVLKLRPGRYEIKFLVDGEWRVAPEWPTTGHGMLENNVLVVE